MTIFAFLLGLIFGSFANVLLLRLNTGESIVNMGSRCFSCGKNIRWFDLVPLFSFLFLRGRCRACKSKVSFRYPLVEFGTGLLFVLIFWKLLTLHGFDAGLLAVGDIPVSFFHIMSWAFVALSWFCLWVASLYDIRHMILPDRLLAAAFVFGALGFVAGCRIGVYPCSFEQIGLQTGAAFLAFLFFFFLWFVSRGKWMGFGDAKFILALAPLLSPYLLLVAIMLSFVIGALAGILLLASQRAGFKTKIPFGPFLFAGALISFLAGSTLLDWYVGLFV